MDIFTKLYIKLEGSPFAMAVLHGLKIAAFYAATAFLTSVAGYLVHNAVILAFVASNPLGLAVFAGINILIAAGIKYFQSKE
jgi:hypothetical protein